jgi:hypothetical protein
METRIPKLGKMTQGGGQAVELESGVWRLEIPPGERGHYRLAQLDDYSGLPRRRFHWRPALKLSLQARASAEALPGTWGFGLWNDPFSLSLGLGGGTRRFPALPNAAWFFFASPPNYLSLRDDLPAQGSLAAVFKSPQAPAALLALVSPGLALASWPLTAGWLRRLGRRWVCQDSASLSILVKEWHTYQIDWTSQGIAFTVDNRQALETPLSPQGPLSLVMWIDNQYAALPPGGRLSFGTLPNPELAWIEIKDFEVQAQKPAPPPV